MVYDKVFITSLPSFYKLRLWNEVATRCKIFVFFTESKASCRNEDFYKGKIQFDHCFVKGNGMSQTYNILKWFIKNKTFEVIYGGWDRIPSLVLPWLLVKSKNSTIIESAIFESKTNGLKSIIKKMFLKRMSKVYVPGISNKDLVHALDYNGKIVISGGCGILNYIEQPAYTPKNIVSKFIYVGRLVPVKNLELLISVFNKLENYELTIVGFGELESKLREQANKNIIFTGAINNDQLSAVYQSNDVFILPSKCEPWGLVVEEALNNGLPVIVSDRVGCGADLATADNGLIFRYNSEDSLREAILKMTDISYYNKLRENISKMDFLKRAEQQVEAFLH